jgi:hypothetical protein
MRLVCRMSESLTDISGWRSHALAPALPVIDQYLAACIIPHESFLSMYESCLSVYESCLSKYLAACIIPRVGKTADSITHTLITT